MTLQHVTAAAKAIKGGKLVAFPTETVYGLGADATNQEAVSNIFRIKGRPQINPLIVHVNDIEQAQEIGIFNSDALKLAKTLWPGPLTLVLPLAHNHNIAQSVTAGLNTVAIRISAHIIARELIMKANTPIAAPSANPSGYISATSAKHVIHNFDNADILILDDLEQSNILGLESTIIDCSNQNLVLLRSGMIIQEQLESITGKNIKSYVPTSKPLAPGMFQSHYAPEVTLKININDNINSNNSVVINFGNSKLSGALNMNLSISGNLHETAKNLYAMLRLADEYAIYHNINQILIAPIPKIDIGIAINDRLQRAAIKIGN